MVPKSDIERFIQAIIDDGDAPSAAKCRIEQYLTDILEERVSTLEPAFRIEYYLAKISGADVELPEPISRADLYLAALAGAEVTLPDTPNSSLEEYLARWCETGNVVSTLTGSIVHFTGRTNTEIQSLSVDLQPIQDLHGYDHPWPGGGGKNLIPLTLETIKTNNTSGTWNGNVYTSGNSTATVQTDEGGNVTGISINTSNSALTLVLWLHPMFDGTAIMNGCPSGGSTSTYYLQYSNYVDGAINETGSGTSAFSAYDLESYPDARVLIVVKSGTYSNLVFKPMIRPASVSDATFFPYSNICPITGWTGANIYVSPTQNQGDATTYNEDWTDEAGTVYGGTLDVVSGVLTVDKRYLTFSSGVTLYGNYGADNAPLYYISFPTAPVIKRAAFSTDDSKLQCNYFTCISMPGDQSMKDCEIRTRGTNTPDRIYFRWDSATDASSINAALANTPLQVIADLQSPLTYQLTPQEVTALLGQNYVWSDDGDVTVVIKGGFTD